MTTNQVTATDDRVKRFCLMCSPRALRKVDEMNQSDVARKNLELMELFTQELLDNEELSRSIPKGAAVFILPDNDPELAAANRKLAQQARKVGKWAVVVRLELVPRMTYVPSLTVVKSTR